MNRLIVAAAVAVSLVGTASTADAASRKRERGYHHYTQAGMWNLPVAMRPVGPPWAMPNECYTDEGYGRYQACGSGRR